MKPTVLILLIAATAAAASTQTHTKPAAPAARPATTEFKLPAGLTPVPGMPKVAFSLRYQDIQIGTGPIAEPNKMYKVQYTGWMGANGRDDDGHKFDSSYDHRNPVVDKDGKPVMGDDGKPKMGDQTPFTFPQGFGRLIPGWDQGFTGMRIGGKRRLFIPWQLAYGAHGRPGPDADHPGIPPKSDLIFDVELLDVTELPMPPNHPATGATVTIPPPPSGQRMPPRPVPAQAAPVQPAAATTPATPAAQKTSATSAQQN
jgi:peptidylprolyl isomerase